MYFGVSVSKILLLEFYVDVVLDCSRFERHDVVIGLAYILTKFQPRQYAQPNNPKSWLLLINVHYAVRIADICAYHDAMRINASVH